MKICSVCGRCFDESVEFCVEPGHSPLAEMRTTGRGSIAGYTLEQLVESGIGFEVYRASRIDCGRSCLIRIVSTDDQIGEAFLRDAERFTKVFHDGVEDIYDAGTSADGHYFVVTEDSGERTLRDELDLCGPDLLTSIRIVEQTAEALSALHALGLIHGSIRPENIVLRDTISGIPAVKIRNIDLGGSIVRNTLSNRFLIDSALDRIKYFSPEQCAGGLLAAGSDIYSLGIVFFEMLAGAPPFDASRAATLMEMHKNKRPPEVAVDDFHLRMLVTHSLSEALQKQPSFRQASASVLARQMRHIEQLATHVSTPPPAMALPAPNRKPLDNPISAPATSQNTVEITHAAGRLGVGEHFAFPKPGSFASKPFREPTSGELSNTVSLERLTTGEEKSALTEHRARLKHWKRNLASSNAASPESRAASDLKNTADLEADAYCPPFEMDSGTHAVSPTDVEKPLPRKLVEWDQPLDDIPTFADVLEVLTSDAVVPIATVENEDLNLISASSGSTSMQSIPPRDPEDHVFLFETVPQDFSLSHVESAASRPVRLVFHLGSLTVGLIAIAVFYFGEFNSSESLAPSVDTADFRSTAAAVDAPRTTTNDESTNGEMSITVETPSPEFHQSLREPSETTALRIKRTPVIASQSSDVRPDPPKTVEKAEVSSPIGSTIVITYNRKESLDRSLAGHSAVKTSSTPPDSAAGATRPRVVTNPRH